MVGCSRSLSSVVCVRAGDDPSRVERARYYWTLRFMGEIVRLSRSRLPRFPSRQLESIAIAAWLPTLEYAQATKMSREAFSPDIYTYANTNNFGSRFFYPGRFDNESLLAFDW